MRHNVQGMYLVEEADGYSASVAGATVEAIRIGRGIGPNHVVAIPGERLSVTRSVIGFPMHCYAEVPEGRVIVAYVNDVSGDSRWCGLRLRGGSVMVYGPGAAHAALNRPGLSFTFVSTELEQLQAAGERSGEPFVPPPMGSLREYTPTTATADLGANLEVFVSAAKQGRPLEPLNDAVLQAIASVLASPHRGRRIGPTRGVDSRDIVHDCVEFAEAIERIPTVSELCLASHVSQRRLRSAFTEEFGEPPSRFFRNWALERARRHLTNAEPTDLTVTEVATGLGFDHLGRFAGYYRRLFGEAPSATLRERAAS